MKLVQIEWVDSHAGRGWQQINDIGQNKKPLYCKSVGWLLTENKECKTLVPHIAGERNGDIEPLGCGDLTIPSKAIIKLTVLKKS